MTDSELKCPCCGSAEQVGPQYVDGEFGVLPVKDMYFCCTGCGCAWDESKRRPAQPPSADAQSPVEAVISIPTSADEAELMQKLGYSWLEQHAPERLAHPLAVGGQDTRTINPHPAQYRDGWEIVPAPANMKLVPVEPTEAMVDAIADADWGAAFCDRPFATSGDIAREAYRAMLAAAPDSGDV